MHQIIDKKHVMSLNTIALPLDFKLSARIRSDLFHICIRTVLFMYDAFLHRLMCYTFRMSECLCCILSNHFDPLNPIVANDEDP